MELDIYHDQSKEAGFWHGILLVPRQTRNDLLNHLQMFRRNTGCESVVSLKGLDKTTGPRYRCIRAWMHFGVASLMQRLKGQGYPFYTGDDGRTTGFDSLRQLIGAKCVLFRVRDGHRPMNGYPDDAARIETTFRMGLKGGLNHFANEEEPLSIESIHFDGYEHYQRRVDSTRILRIGELKPNVSFSRSLSIHDESGDHARPQRQSYDDCQFLQLTDLLVSGFRTVLSHATHNAQETVAYPLKEFAIRWHEGAARMRQSRWYKGFCISECFLENENWKFSDIRPKPEERRLELGI